MRCREPDALQRSAALVASSLSRLRIDEVLQTLYRQRQMRTTLVAQKRMDFVDNQAAYRGQHCAAARTGEQ